MPGYPHPVEPGSQELASQSHELDPGLREVEKVEEAPLVLRGGDQYVIIMDVDSIHLGDGWECPTSPLNDLLREFQGLRFIMSLVTGIPSFTSSTFH